MDISKLFILISFLSMPLCWNCSTFKNIWSHGFVPQIKLFFLLSIPLMAVGADDECYPDKWWSVLHNPEVPIILEALSLWHYPWGIILEGLSWRDYPGGIILDGLSLNDGLSWMDYPWGIIPVGLSLRGSFSSLTLVLYSVYYSYPPPNLSTSIQPGNIIFYFCLCWLWLEFLMLCCATVYLSTYPTPIFSDFHSDHWFFLWLFQ